MTKSRKINRPRCTWTPEQLQLVDLLYPHMPSAALAQRLGVRLEQLYACANRRGLKKTQAFLESGESGRLAAERARTHPTIVANQFKKGHAPANKGLRRPGYGPGRMKSTQFKKGQPPHTTLPVGTEIHRGGRDRYVYVKVANDRQPSRRSARSSSTRPAPRWSS